MKFIAIIPARYASTRFPGKPLVDICGKSMIQRVYEQVSKAVKAVYVATDDKRIYDTVEAFGGNVVMTSVLHKSGTDRCDEAYQEIYKKTGNNYDVIINVQGDEPFIHPNQISSLKLCFKHEKTDIATLVKKIDTEEELFDINKVKVVKDDDGKALYFSRQTIPFIRGVDKSEWLKSNTFFKHIGMYAYKTATLQSIAKMNIGVLENCESLEQLRWLEKGLTIMTAETEIESIGIDSPDDLLKIKL